MANTSVESPQMMTATILFADIKGFTKLGLNEKRLLRRVIEKEAMQAVSKAVGENKPIVYNSWGDAYLLVFSSIQAGVRAALELRDSFTTRTNWKELGFRQALSIRCSLHVGDVVSEEFDVPFSRRKRKDVIGRNIDLAARIEPKTPPGRIWVTSRVSDALKDDDDLKSLICQDLGERELAKGWGVHRLCDVSRPSDAELDPQLLVDYPHDLAEISPVDLKTGDLTESHLILICGPSAVGKDAIGSRLRGRLEKLGLSAAFAKKYTSREPRETENEGIEDLVDGRWPEPSSNYEFLKENQFESHEDVIGFYEKYEHQYGYSLKHLRSQAKKYQILIGIFGDLERIEAFAETVREKTKRRVLIFLLAAPTHELERRLDTRIGMSSEIVRIRRKELRLDIARLQRLPFTSRNVIRLGNENSDNPDKVCELLLWRFFREIGLLKTRRDS